MGEVKRRRPGYPKRLFDLGLASLALLMLSPLLLLVALAVRAKLGRPILFRHVRPGLGGRPFTLFKFRTMADRRDERGEPLPDAERLTRFGALLRSTSLDELPQLWNVVRGDMSLVGPRPLMMHYLELYTPFQRRRHEVRPGLTGWAQVRGRNALSWPEKFALDVWYVDHMGFWLDLRILLLTVGRVLFRQGISAEGEATMPFFTGEPPPRDGGEDQASGPRSGAGA